MKEKALVKELRAAGVRKKVARKLGAAAKTPGGKQSDRAIESAQRLRDAGWLLERQAEKTRR